MASPIKAKASNLTRASVENLAESLSHRLGYVPDMELSKIASKFGGKISYKDFSDAEEDGSIIIRSENDFEIFLPTHTSPLRDRFTVAHELGHYVLHYLWAKRSNPKLGPVYATRYGSDRSEWEANWFAAAFLMPESDVKEVCENQGASVAEIAGAFCVSTSAAEIRLKRLALLTDIDEPAEENFA